MEVFFGIPVFLFFWVLIFVYSFLVGLHEIYFIREDTNMVLFNFFLTINEQCKFSSKDISTAQIITYIFLFRQLSSFNQEPRGSISQRRVYQWNDIFRYWSISGLPLFYIYIYIYIIINIKVYHKILPQFKTNYLWFQILYFSILRKQIILIS